MTDATRILIVDDDPITAKILCNALGGMGTIHVATGGAEALQIAAEYPIDLVLLDIVMPTMDGLETGRALLRDHPDLHIVFLAAASEPAVEVQALEVGGHDFIGKPIDPPVVRARVALQLKLKAQETARNKRNLLLTTVLTNMDAHVYMKDREGRFLYANRAVAELLGRPAEEIVGHLETEFIPAANLDDIRAVDIQVFASGSRQSREERFTDQEGIARYFWSVKVPLIHAGRSDALIGISTDITELRQLREELERRATTDSLTGIANRGHFYQQANLHFKRAERYGEALSLLALDIDRFKSINDTYGHQAGDIALRALAEHFRQGIRAFDLIGRIGGEEFAILLPNTDLDGAVTLAERLRETLSALRLKVDGGTELAVAVSIGAASLLPTDASLDILFARADKALYRAKEGGRNRVVTIEERLPGKRASIIRLIWQAGYDCGDPVIDSEHRELFRLANELLNFASADASPHVIHAALDRLLAHVVDHFAHEEATLRRHGYEDVEHHAELHKHLVERAQALRAQSDKEGIEFGDLVQFLVQDVVARHILQADRTFFGLFAKPKAP